MYAKLEFLLRFWALSLRHRHAAHTPAALSEGERQELLSLMQLVSGELLAPRRPRAGERLSEGVPVEIAGGGQLTPALLIEVAAGGLLISLSPHETPDVGDSLLLAAPGDHGELTVPCRVLWRTLHQQRAVLGLEVDGVPHAPPPALSRSSRRAPRSSRPAPRSSRPAPRAV